jgi:hypothetical protein
MTMEQIKEIQKKKDSWLDRIPGWTNSNNLLQKTRRGQGSGGSMAKIGAMVRDGVKLGMQMSGQDTKDFDSKNLKALSPRILSVTAAGEGNDNNNDTVEMLSPSLFSLHGKGKGLERSLSLPEMTKGMSSRDQNEWLNLIMEASGVNEQTEFAKVPNILLNSKIIFKLRTFLKAREP